TATLPPHSARRARSRRAGAPTRRPSRTPSAGRRAARSSDGRRPRSPRACNGCRPARAGARRPPRARQAANRAPGARACVSAALASGPAATGAAARADQPQSRTPNMRDQQRIFTRARLVEAAVKRFGEVGYPSTTIEEIVAEAGASRATFYLHFNSKLEV